MAFAVTRELPEREYCVQYRETDLAFIERLAAEEGLFYFHLFDEKGEEGAHRLIFADDPQVLINENGEYQANAHDVQVIYLNPSLGTGPEAQYQPTDSVDAPIEPSIWYAIDPRTMVMSP